MLPSLRCLLAPCHHHVQVEIVNVSNFLLRVREDVKFSMNLHSYGQMILLPWGWTHDTPDNIDRLTEVTTPPPSLS